MVSIWPAEFLDGAGVACRKLGSLPFGEDAANLGGVVDKYRLIADGHGDDVVKGKVAEDAGLDLNLFGVGLPLHLVAGTQLKVVEYASLGKHFLGCGSEVCVEDFGHRGLAVETATGSFLFHSSE